MAPFALRILMQGRYVTLNPMESPSESKALVPAESRPLTSVAARAGILVPRVIAAAGDQAARRFLEFFAAIIRNKNTRQAYYHAVLRFFAWCDRHKIGEIVLTGTQARELLDSIDTSTLVGLRDRALNP
jgi:hypothetical protein